MGAGKKRKTNGGNKGTAFGRRLQTLRESVVPPLPAKELDRLAGMAEGHVIQIEHRSTDNVAARTVLRLSEVFGTSMDWLYAGKGEQPAANDVQAAVRALRESGAGRRK